MVNKFCLFRRKVNFKVNFGMEINKGIIFQEAYIFGTELVINHGLFLGNILF